MGLDALLKLGQIGGIIGLLEAESLALLFTFPFLSADFPALDAQINLSLDVFLDGVIDFLLSLKLGLHI